MLERTDEQRGRGVVDDKRHPEFAPDCRNLADREHLQFGIGQRFGIVGAGTGICRTPEILRVGGIDEPDLDADVFQCRRGQRPGAPVEVGGTDDVVAGAGKVEH
jgi:hypothetical protein